LKMLLNLAFRNLLRYGVRSGITVMGVACSVSLFFSVLSFHVGFQENLAAQIQRSGTDFMIVPKGCSYEVASLVLYGAVLPKYLDSGILQTVAAMEGVEGAAPILVAQIPDRAGGRVDLVYGVSMGEMSRMKPSWKWEGTLPREDQEALVGELFAQSRGLGVGGMLEYPDRGLRLRITGILRRTNSHEDTAVFLPLAAVQALVNTPGAVTSIAVKARHPMLIPALRDELALRVPGIQVVTMDQVLDTISNLAGTAKAMTLSIAVVALGISILGLMNFVLITTYERVPEIGILRAMGASRWDIRVLSVVETGTLVGSGVVVGILLSLLTSGLVEELVRRVTPFVPSGKMSAFDPVLAVWVAVGAFVVGLLSGLYPAQRASRVRPREVIRC